MSAANQGLKIVHKGIILVSVPLSIGVFILLSLAFLFDQAEIETTRETRTREIMSLANDLSRRSFDALAAVSYYAASRDQMFADRYQQIKNENDQSSGTAQGQRIETGKTGRASAQSIRR